MLPFHIIIIIFIGISFTIATPCQSCTSCLTDCIIQNCNTPNSLFLGNESCPFGNIIITNATIGNLSAQINNQITMFASDINLENSTIMGSIILINASNSVTMSASSLSSDKASFYYNKSCEKSINSSNYFAGSGSQCSNYEPCYYGSYNGSDYTDNLVTMGNGNPYLPGGGKIIITTEILNIDDGTISARGAPLTLTDCKGVTSPNLNGGTGGYIYLDYNQININNVSSSQGLYLDTSGGDGICLDESSGQIGLGASGGRIVILNAINITDQEFDYSVHGGKSYYKKITCTDGASGTIYFGLNETNSQVYITGGGNSASLTSFSLSNISTILDIIVGNGGNFQEDQNDSQNQIILGNIIINNSSSFSSQSNTLIANSISISNSSNLSLSSTTNLAINGDLTLSVNSILQAILLPTSNFIINATSLIMNQNCIILASSNIETNTNLIIILNQNVTLLNQSQFSSNMLVISAQNILYQNSLLNYSQSNCIVDPLLPFIIPNFTSPLSFNSFFGTSDNFLNTINAIQNNYTIIFFASEDLNLMNITLINGDIGLFANNIIIDQESMVESTGLGCGADLGIGTSKTIFSGAECGLGGATYGGFGGNGLAFEGQSILCLQAELYQQQIYGDPNNPLYMGSGGGSSGEGDNGGAGGGRIIIGSANLLEIFGNVQSNGLGPAYGNESYSGGGSGGAIQLFMTNLTGSGIISANGGNGSLYGGEGGGGRIRLNFLQWFNNLIYDNNTQINLTIEVSNGYRPCLDCEISEINLYMGQNGTLTSTPCLPGYFGWQCYPCPIGTFKDSFSNVEYCNLCGNKPSASCYTSIAQNNPGCEYACNIVGFTGISTNDCYTNVLTYMISERPDLILFAVFIVWGIFLIVLAIRLIVHICKTISRKKAKANDNKLASIYATNKDCFVLRIYIYGSNTPGRPWFINLSLIDFKEISDLVVKFEEMALIFNKISKWKQSHILLIKILSVFYLPLYFVVMRWIKKSIHRKLKKHINESNKSLKEFCEINGFQVLRMVFEVSKDLTLGFIDIYQSSNNSKNQKSHMPLTIIFNGDGNFMNPLYLNKQDPLLGFIQPQKSFLLSSDEASSYYKPGQRSKKNKNQDQDKLSKTSADAQFNSKLDLFYDELNYLLRFIDFRGRKSKLQKSCANIVKYIQRANEKYFNPHYIHADLVAFQVPFHSTASELTKNLLSVSATILENPFNPIFNQYISDISRKKRSSVKEDIKLGLFFYGLNKDIENNPLDQSTKSIYNKLEYDVSLPQSPIMKNDSDIYILRKNLYNKKNGDTEMYRLPVLTSNKAIGIKSMEKIENVLLFEERIGFMISHTIAYETYTMSYIDIYLFFFLFLLLQMVLLTCVVTSLLLGNSPFIAGLLLPFPFTPIIAPYLGVWALFSPYVKFSKNFAIFNLLSIFNNLINFSLVVIESSDGFLMIQTSISVVTTIILQALASYVISAKDNSIRE